MRKNLRFLALNSCILFLGAYFTMSNPAYSQEKKKLTRSASASASSTEGPSLEKKDLWLGAGLSLTMAGAGHLYVGKYSSAMVFFFGSYGLMGAGIASMLTAHATRDVVVDGNIVREEDNTNRPLFIIGSIFLVAGILFYFGGVVDIFLEVSDYNKRIDRIRRYGKKSSSFFSGNLYLSQKTESTYGGQTFYF